jgi:hypothetical protein
MFSKHIQQRKIINVLSAGLFLSSTSVVAMDVPLDESAPLSMRRPHSAYQSVDIRSAKHSLTNPNEDIIIDLARFKVALAQEEEGQHDLANYNYHLAYGEPIDKALRGNSIDFINLARFKVALAQEEEGQHVLANYNYHLAYGEPIDKVLHSNPIGIIDLMDYSQRVKKDMKLRKRVLSSYRAQEAGDFLGKYVAPTLWGISSVLIPIPDPSGITPIVGVSIGLAGGVTKAGGWLITRGGKNVKVHYCKKVNIDPSTLNLREEKILIKKEKSFLKAIKKSNSLEEKIGKNDEKKDSYISKKILVDRKISNLKHELAGEPKLNYLHTFR